VLVKNKDYSNTYCDELVGMSVNCNTLILKSVFFLALKLVIAYVCNNVMTEGDFQFLFVHWPLKKGKANALTIKFGYS